jgi:hypothetical protein
VLPHARESRTSHVFEVVVDPGIAKELQGSEKAVVRQQLVFITDHRVDRKVTVPVFVLRRSVNQRTQ